MNGAKRIARKLDHAFPRKGATDSLIAAVSQSLLESWSDRSTMKSAVLLSLSERNPNRLPTIDPLGFTDPLDFFHAYQAVSLFAKYPFGEDRDRAEVGVKGFHDSEAQCLRTNVRISRSTEWVRDCPLWPAVIMTARRKIERLIGGFSLDDAERHMGFGPGATTSLRRSRSDMWYKFGHKPDVTSNCAVLAWCAVYRIPRWFEFLTGSLPRDRAEDFATFPPDRIFNLVTGNRITTVPKSFKTDRVIAVEPDLNMFVQKGLGGVLRERLRRVGINLNSQTTNQSLARLGSITGLLATVDLSSASDTISLAICEELLPDDWMTAIKLCRSPVGTLPDGSTVNYRKVSSMGNGFTFELETLIFWALTKSVCELTGQQGIAIVYGDDILCPYGIQSELRSVLNYAGFTVNEGKSFFTGPFRESCGKHYFQGSDVTPIYIRERPTSFPDVVALCNKIRRAARLSYGLDSSYRPAYEMLVSQLPLAFRNKIPDEFGDVGLISDFDEAAPSWDRNTQSFSFSVVLPIRDSVAGCEDVPLLLKSLYGLELKGIADDGLTEVSDVRVKRSTGRWKRAKSRTTVWSSYGPWL